MVDEILVDRKGQLYHFEMPEGIFVKMHRLNKVLSFVESKLGNCITYGMTKYIYIDCKQKIVPGAEAHASIITKEKETRASMSYEAGSSFIIATAGLITLRLTISLLNPALLTMLRFVLFLRYLLKFRYQVIFSSPAFTQKVSSTISYLAFNNVFYRILF